MLQKIGRKIRRAGILAVRAAKQTASRVRGHDGPVVFRANAADDGYQLYLERQKEKTSDRAERLLTEMWDVKVEGFRDLFRKYEHIISPGQKALCIGARTGQEVAVLREMGMDAVGVDLIAFPPFVIEADMHNLPFEDGEFDFVFSNVFDHTPKPQQKISEMERVCKTDGHCALWLQLGYTTDPYAENQILEAAPVLRLFQESRKVWAKEDRTIFDGMNYSILMRRS